MKTEYEFILAGSGIAATLVAQTLLEANPQASILMLEAGEIIPLRDRGFWWDLVLRGKTPYSRTYDREGEESFTTGDGWGFKESRVRAFGGSTMHWGGWSLRYQPEDFECHSRTGRGADWPFGYRELEPWYEKAEAVLNVAGQAADPHCPPRRGAFPSPPFVWSANEAELATAFEDQGLKPGHMPIARFNRCMTTGTCKYCPIGSRYTAQDQLAALLSPRHPNFVLKTEAPAIAILAEPKRVVGIRYLDGTDEKTAEADRIVVCAGAYESPKLLLRSTSEAWPTGLGNRHDQVGRYLVTHSMMRVSGLKASNPDRWFQEYDFPTLMSRTWDGPARQRQGKVFLFNNRGLPKVDIAAAMMAGKDRAQVDEVVQGPKRAGLDAFIEEFGQAESRVTLRPGTGQFGLPKTEVTFSRAADVPATANKVMAEMASILARLGYTVTKDDMKLETPRGDHSVGTCRMGPNESQSVTNANLQVHGVDNLYVCSNAVFPTVAAVNPTLTLAAMSLRLGSHLTGGEA